MTNYTLSLKGRAFRSRWEGRITYVYDDAVAPTRRWVKGTAVRGYLTAGEGHLLDAAEAKQWAGKTIPADVIESWVSSDVAAAERAVSNLVKVPLTTNQADALIVFADNVGVGAFGSSTLLRKLNAHNYDAVATELMKWTKTTINHVKVTSSGLQARRAAEGMLFNSGLTIAAPKGDAQPAATEVGSIEPKSWSPTEIVGAGGTVATVAAAGFSTQGVLAYVFAGILVVAVLAIGVLIVKRQWFRS